MRQCAATVFFDFRVAELIFYEAYAIIFSGVIL